jgi:hypothetical protein
MGAEAHAPPRVCPSIHRSGSRRTNGGWCPTRPSAFSGTSSAPRSTGGGARWQRRRRSCWSASRVGGVGWRQQGGARPRGPLPGQPPPEHLRPGPFPRQPRRPSKGSCPPLSPRQPPPVSGTPPFAAPSGCSGTCTCSSRRCAGQQAGRARGGVRGPRGCGAACRGAGAPLGVSPRLWCRMASPSPAAPLRGT